MLSVFSVVSLSFGLFQHREHRGTEGHREDFCQNKQTQLSSVRTAAINHANGWANVLSAASGIRWSRNGSLRLKKVLVATVFVGAKRKPSKTTNTNHKITCASLPAWTSSTVSWVAASCRARSS